MINDQTRDDIRGLFDWRNAASRIERTDGATSSSTIANDDLALALQLLSCNSRDREQFTGARDGTATAA